MEIVKIPNWLRWVALIFASLAMFGNYYLYDSVSYVADLLEKAFDIDDDGFAKLYSFYSYAAIGILFFSGVFIDRFGTRLSIIVFGAICALSGFLTAFTSNFNVMLVGRFLLGLGAEPLIVAVTVALAKWFKGKELGFALGINLFIARLGSIVADWSPTWAKNSYDIGWQPPLVIAAFIGSLCLIGGIFYYLVEWKTQKKYVLSEAGETDKLELKGIFSFNKSFWYVVLLCVTFYSAIFPFRGFAIKYFQEAHNVSREFAGQLNSILPTVALFATPAIGYLIDRIGRRASLMFIGSIIILPVYLMMTYLGWSLYIPVIFMGIAFSLIPAVMWPSVAYIVEEKKLGTAYAIMTLLQQVGVAGFVELIGIANKTNEATAANPGGYAMGMWLFSVLGLIGMIFSFLLYRAETGGRGHGLERPNIEKD
jgi:MFS family permease